MPDPVFLAYAPDPFDTGASTFWLSDEKTDPTEISAQKLASIDGAVITLDLNSLIDTLRRLRTPLPPCIVDLEDALKLSTGRAKGEIGVREASVWSAMRKGAANSKHLNAYEAILKANFRGTPDRVPKILAHASATLRSTWRYVDQMLGEHGERSRFWEVEVPIRQIFAFRTYHGIPVDAEKVKTHLDAAKREKYAAYKEVAEHLNVSPSGLNIWNVRQYLDRTDVREIADTSDAGRLEDYLRVASGRSKFANSFLTYVRAGRDLNVLAQLGSKEGRVYPWFDTMGSVTARILVSSPNCQTLRRKYRSVFAAEPTEQLAYLDYAQFEPGIMASLSQDEGLIEAYNTKDLYSSLSEAVFGDGTSRDVCKRLFLGFCYGMTIERMASLISSPEGISRDEAAQRIATFFSAFPKLTAFTRQRAEEVSRSGFASSLFGNSRRRRRTGELSAKERRWAVNHPIQATASLIFKEAVIKISAHFGPGTVLLPMHDAVLLSFPQRAYTDAVTAATSLMSDAFRTRCPQLTPKITNNAF